MTNEKTKHPTATLIKGLVYLAISLLLINVVLALFIPALEVYQPSKGNTDLGIYVDWYVNTATMLEFIFPIIFILPQALVVGGVVRKKENSPLVKMLNNTVDKPIKFKMAIVSTVAYLISMYLVYILLKNDISVYEKQGGYCRFTAGGVISIIVNIVIVLVLVALSLLSKQMVASPNAAEEATSNKDEGENL